MFLFRLNHHAVVMSRDPRPAHLSSVFLVQPKENIKLSEFTMACSKEMLAYPVLVWFSSEVVSQLLSTIIAQDIYHSSSVWLTRYIISLSFWLHKFPKAPYIFLFYLWVVCLFLELVHSCSVFTYLANERKLQIPNTLSFKYSKY